MIKKIITFTCVYYISCIKCKVVQKTLLQLEIHMFNKMYVQSLLQILAITKQSYQSQSVIMEIIIRQFQYTKNRNNFNSEIYKIYCNIYHLLSEPAMGTHRNIYTCSMQTFYFCMVVHPCLQIIFNLNIKKLQ